MSTSLSGQIALVTGANRGIGRSIVEALLKNDAKKVYLAVREPSSVADLEAEYGARVEALAVDLRDVDTIKAAAKRATDVSVVINNAGVLKTANPLSENAEEALRYELDVNTFGLIRVAQAFVPVLESNKGGVLVQLNSVASIKNFFDFTTYSASKAASYSVTQGIKDSVADKGIRVISVHPGPIDTDMTKDLDFDMEMPSAMVVADSILEAIQDPEVFHVFPDPVAKQFEQAYQQFADNVILAPTE